MVVICVLSCCVSDYLLYYLCILIFFFYFSFCFFFILFIGILLFFFFFFFFSSRRRHTRSLCDWSSDVCSSDLDGVRQWLAADLGDLVVGGLLRIRRVVFDELDGVGFALDESEDGIRMRLRSEERRVGKECRSRGSADQ